MITLANQKVLVIGGSTGIGFATAKLAKELGAEVTIGSRSDENVRAATASIGASGRVVDITSDESVADFFRDGVVWDHVIVTASQVKIAPVRDLALDTARASFDSKFWGFYRVAKAASIKPGGSLGVLAGYLAKRPVAGRALMGAINGALESLVQGLALELKPVRVNAVSPGTVESTMWKDMTEDAREAMYDRVRSTFPAGCVGQPDDIARQLLLLAATPFATGVVVTLDGGASIA